MGAIIRIGLVGLCLAALGGCQAQVSSDQQAEAADHFLASQLYADSGNVELALEELSRAVQINDQMALAYSKMGEIYQTRGQLTQAADSYAKAVAIDPKSLGDLVRLGSVYQALGRWPDAVGAYLKAIAVQPDYYQGHFELGTLYYRQNRLADAEQEFARCIALNKRRADAFAQLGVVYYAEGRYPEASRSFRDALDKDLNQPKVLLNSGLAYIKRDMYNQACNVLTLAAKQNDQDPQVYQNLAACYYRLAVEAAGGGEDRPPSIERCVRFLELSIAAYRRAVELDGEDARSLSGLGAAQMLLARNVADPARRLVLKSEAVDCWRQSLELDPNQPALAAMLHEFAPPNRASDMPRP